MTFGQELNRRRKEFKLNIRELALITTIHESFLFDLEMNRRTKELTPFNLYKLGEALDWSVDDMILQLRGVAPERPTVADTPPPHTNENLRPTL